MQRMICALLLSFVAMLVIGPKVIPLLHKLNFGQTIYDLGPKTHKSKQGTPIMGSRLTDFLTEYSLQSQQFTHQSLRLLRELPEMDFSQADRTLARRREESLNYLKANLRKK